MDKLVFLDLRRINLKLCIRAHQMVKRELVELLTRTQSVGENIV